QMAGEAHGGLEQGSPGRRTARSAASSVGADLGSGLFPRRATVSTLAAAVVHRPRDLQHGAALCGFPYMANPGPPVRAWARAWLSGLSNAKSRRSDRLPRAL